MNHLKYVVFACLFFLGALPANAQVTYDVYIGAGQSNFDGRGDVDDLTGELAPFAAPQVGTLIYYNNPPEPDPNDTLDQAITTNGFVTLEPGYSFLGARDFDDNPTIPSDIFGPEVAFGSAIAAETGSTNPVAIIKVSRGGTNLDNDWTAPDADAPNGGPLYIELLDTIDAALAELTANGDSFVIRGFIWHQGESDSSGAENTPISGRASRYMENFVNLIEGVRTHVGIPDLPVVMGQLAQSRLAVSNPGFLVLQAEIADALDNVALASSVGLTTPFSTGEGTDATHFDAAGQIGLGLEFAEVLADLIAENSPVDPNQPPELVTFDMDNGASPGLEPLGSELDSLDEPTNEVDSPSTATLAGITFVATAETTIVDATPSDPANPSGATFNAATNGAGVNSIGGSADGDGGAGFVDPGETLTLALNFDESTTTVALTQITFRSVSGATDSVTLSIAGSPAVTFHDDIPSGQVANTTFTFEGDTFTVAEPIVLLSGESLVFDNFSTADQGYQIMGFTLEIGTPSAPPSLIGDFDDDGDVDVDDIDHYVGNIDTTAAGDTIELDLVVDGEITFADLEFHIENFVQTNNEQTGTFLGDFNLDGTVDVLTDAFNLVGGLGNPATSYANGDINLDGIVDVLGDAFILIGNLGMSNDP